jgi:hypothetical protein
LGRSSMARRLEPGARLGYWEPRYSTSRRQASGRQSTSPDSQRQVWRRKAASGCYRSASEPSPERAHQRSGQQRVYGGGRPCPERPQELVRFLQRGERQTANAYGPGRQLPHPSLIGESSIGDRRVIDRRVIDRLNNRLALARKLRNLVKNQDCRANHGCPQAAFIPNRGLCHIRRAHDLVRQAVDLFLLVPRPVRIKLHV